MRPSGLFLCYTGLMNFKKDESKTYDLSKLPSKPVELPQMPVKKTWSPQGETHTMPFGGQLPRVVDVQQVIKDKKVL